MITTEILQFDKGVSQDSVSGRTNQNTCQKKLFRDLGEHSYREFLSISIPHNCTHISTYKNNTDVN